MAFALIVSACSGSSGDGDAQGDGGGDTESDANTARPEGAWTMISWTTSRSDAPDLPKGEASEGRLELAPTCDSGPCDVEVTPNGADGTYLPEGVTSIEGDTPNTDPYTFEWNETDQSYTVVADPRVTSCTIASGEVVPDAYEFTTTRTLRFRPPDGETPAGLVGTYATSVTSTAAGEPAGCTPFEEAGSIVASPTGALEGSDTVDLAGEYTVTEIVEAVVPEGQRNAGVRGLLPPVTLEGSGEDYTIASGLGTTTPLTESASGYSGASPVVPQPGCPDSGNLPDGYSSSETWTDLQPVALTEQGTPVLSGGWQVVQEPTEAAATAGCVSSSNTGYVILVPTASIA